MDYSVISFSGQNLGDDLREVSVALSRGLQNSELYLGSNNITSSGAIILAKTLSANKEVRKIYLGINKIDDTGAHAFAEMLKYNKCLEKLILSSNQITLDGACALQQSLETNSSLVSLDISNNCILDYEHSETYARIQKQLKTNRLHKRW